MLTYKDGSFFLDGNKINIYSGALHYFRVLPELWEDRLQKLKDMGLNTVETYVEWNFHEYKKGVWDFGGWRDVAKFIKTAQKVGLYAIVRPGPYICAERNNGGLPYYLIADKNARVRCYEEKYLERVSEFYRRVLAALAPLQHSKGGNIIAFQIENEYGSFGNDKRYLNFCKDAIIQNGITELLFTSDGTAQYMLTGGTVDGVLPTGNFGSGGRGNFANLKKSAPEGAPMMCAEYWLGWFDYFGGIHHRRPVKTITPDIRFFLENNHNFSLYMFHGGTNFGFSGGANYDGTYRPHTTSYDYDAPLNEWGGYTKKYHALRKLLFEAQGLPLTPLAETAPPKQLKSIEIQKAVPLLSLKRGKPIISTCPITVEEAGGTDGLIIYKHIVKGAYPGSKIHLDGLADYGFVYVNGEFKGKAERNCNGAIAVGDLKKDD
ncbi:MAG: beta-galactosidase, partial [Christensenellaceae bacterium]|nr:beta-galactosidase [Christensenellaceae bacterium]